MKIEPGEKAEELITMFAKTFHGFGLYARQRRERGIRGALLHCKIYLESLHNLHEENKLDCIYKEIVFWNMVQDILLLPVEN